MTETNAETVCQGLWKVHVKAARNTTRGDSLSWTALVLSKLLAALSQVTLSGLPALPPPGFQGVNFDATEVAAGCF